MVDPLKNALGFSAHIKLTLAQLKKDFALLLSTATEEMKQEATFKEAVSHILNLVQTVSWQLVTPHLTAVNESLTNSMMSLLALGEDTDANKVRQCILSFNETINNIHLQTAEDIGIVDVCMPPQLESWGASVRGIRDIAYGMRHAGGILWHNKTEVMLATPLEICEFVGVNTFLNNTLQ